MDASKRAAMERSRPAGSLLFHKIKASTIINLSGHIKAAIKHRCTDLGIIAKVSSEANVAVMLINH